MAILERKRIRIMVPVEVDVCRLDDNPDDWEVGDIIHPSKSLVENRTKKALLEEAFHRNFSDQIEISGGEVQDGVNVIFAYHTVLGDSYRFSYVCRDGKYEFKELK